MLTVPEPPPTSATYTRWVKGFTATDLGVLAAPMSLMFVMVRFVMLDPLITVKLAGVFSATYARPLTTSTATAMGFVAAASVTVVGAAVKGCEVSTTWILPLFIVFPPTTPEFNTYSKAGFTAVFSAKAAGPRPTPIVPREAFVAPLYTVTLPLVLLAT